MCKHHMLLKLRRSSQSISLEISTSEFNGTCFVEKILKTELKLQRYIIKLISLYLLQSVSIHIYMHVQPIIIPISPIGSWIGM